MLSNVSKIPKGDNTDSTHSKQTKESISLTQPVFHDMDHRHALDAQFQTSGWHSLWRNISNKTLVHNDGSGAG